MKAGTEHLPEMAGEEVHGDSQKYYELYDAHFGWTDVEHGCRYTESIIHRILTVQSYHALQ